MRKQVRLSVLGGFALVSLAWAGCGQKTLPVKQTYSVQGKLTHKGEPLSFVMLQLEPVKPGEGAIATGATKADGTFTLRTYSNGEPDGAAAGEYKVILEPYDPVKAGSLPEGAKATPVKPELAHSGVTVEIKEEENQEVAIEIP